MTKFVKKFMQKFIVSTRKPLFILGITFWVAVFGFLMADSLSFSTTGHAITEMNSVYGIPGSAILVILLIVLSIVLYFVWKNVLKLKVKKKTKRQVIK